MIQPAKQSTDEPLFLTVEQVAQRLQIGNSIVYSLISAGKIPAHRFGLKRGTIRVSLSDLEKYLEECRVEDGATTSQSLNKRLRHITIK